MKKLDVKSIKHKMEKDKMKSSKNVREFDTLNNIDCSFMTFIFK